MQKSSEYHEIRGPGVYGSHQPSELHASHDLLHTLERFVRTGPVIQEQQDASTYLDSEEKQRDAAQEVPIRELVNGDGLMTQGLGQFRPAEALINPVVHVPDDLHLRLPACGSRRFRCREYSLESFPAAAAADQRYFARQVHR